MKRAVPSRLHTLLVEIAAKHNFRLPEEGVVECDRELLIDTLLQELLDTGLETDGEPNQRGIQIEEIIDFVDFIDDQSDTPSD